MRTLPRCLVVIILTSALLVVPAKARANGSDRYTARYENSVSLRSASGWPYSGPRRAKRHCQPANGSAGYQGQSPWLDWTFKTTIVFANDPPGAEWHPSAREALQTSRAFVAVAESTPLEVVDLEQATGQSDPKPAGDPKVAAPQDPQPTPPVHPTPKHTGIAALVRTTAADFVAFPKRRSTWVILAIGGGLAALSHPLDDDVNGRLAGSEAVARFFAPGKVMGSMYTHVGVSVGLYAIGRYLLPPATGETRTNKVSHLGFDLLRAQIVSQTMTHTLKATIRRNRPTGECCAFPSGHATTAFAAAAVIERHFGYRMAWPTMVAATYVAASRLHDNRHFLSDVVFGAAIGTATGWTIVGRHGRSNYALLPTPVRGGMALSIVTHPAF